MPGIRNLPAKPPPPPSPWANPAGMQADPLVPVPSNVPQNLTNEIHQEVLNRDPANNSPNLPSPNTRLSITPAKPAELSFQAAVGRAISPAIKSLGGTDKLSTLNSALASLPEAPSAKTAAPNLSQGIALTIQGMTTDYKQGLNTMLANVGKATPLQDILKGMGELLAYPTGATTTGPLAGAPALGQDPLLQQIYQNLQTERTGGTLAINQGTGSGGYGQSPLATATG